MVVKCPNCQKLLKIEDDVTGRQRRCPGCQSTFIVPRPAAGEAVAAPRAPLLTPEEEPLPVPAHPSPRPPKGRSPGSVLSFILNPGSGQLESVRIAFALGLMAVVCLITFMTAMRWSIGVQLFSVLLLVAGIAAAIVGGIARSPRDIVLGCVAIIAAFSTPVFASVIFALARGVNSHGQGYYAMRVFDIMLGMLSGLAHVVFELVPAFALLAIVPLLLRKQ
jgi:hypothetical protein